jgi:hypothetical protein
MESSVREDHYNLVRGDSHALTCRLWPNLMIGKYQFLKITTTLGGFEAVPTKVEFLTQWGIWVRQFSNNSLHSLPESRILRSEPGAMVWKLALWA